MVLLSLLPLFFVGHKRILIERIRALIKAFTILIPEAKQGLPDMSVRAVVAHASQVISIDGDERDLYTGKLTKEAKDEIVAGHRKCTHADLRITSMDYIEAPICSFEFRPLAAILILISKRLNKFFNLPIEPQWNNVGWNTIIARHAKGTLRIREVFPKCFRFNLRFLSRFRLIASFAIVLGTIFLKRIGILSYLVLFITMSYIFYEGSFRYYGINFAHVRKLLFGLI